MASGTGNLPYPGKSYTPFDILTAEELNEDVANIESLATGTGIGDGSIATAALANASVTAQKIDFATFADYSTSEINTGIKWVDGKTIYKKTINFGGLPNNTTKSVPHGISGLDTVVFNETISKNGSGDQFNIPFSSSAGLVFMYVNSTNLNIVTTSNRTDFTVTYTTIYYTKT